MKLTAKQFRDMPNKVVTLLGMSGVGKTTFSSKLPTDAWFHYSGDYRIATRYLDEAILDEVKRIAMENEHLKSLLLKDSVYIRNNFSIHQQHALLSFLGKIGNPALGGLSIDEFKHRQTLFRESEIRAMEDVSLFMDKAQRIYGYPHFLNDAGGSICGLTGQECWDQLSRFSVIIYLHASESMEQVLLERARKNPKPLFYENAFLDLHLLRYIEENSLRTADEIIPNEFVRWIFPLLAAYRKPQYERIAKKYGYTVEVEKISDVRDEADIIDLICDSIVLGN